MILHLILSISFLTSPIVGQPSTPPSIEEALTAIRALPEGELLLRTIEAEGPITFEYREIDDFDFGAMWDSRTRTVVVNAKRCRSQGIMISSLLFELHNAKTTQHLINESRRAIAGKISKDRYVENIERMEHQNALDTIAILEEGIANGTFPSTAQWTIIRDFDDHYMLQQLSGHSHWIAHNFDSMVKSAPQPYHGTIKEFDTLSPQDKKELSLYLSIKNKPWSDPEEDVIF